MDEVEFRQAYNNTCTAVEGITDAATKRALLMTLQLVDALSRRIEDMQLDDD